MSTADQLTELERFTALAELTSEQLVERGEALIKLGHKLAALGMGILPSDAVVSESATRSVGRLGVVDERVAIQVAKTLGTFDRPAFAEALGLRVGATSKWLTALMRHRPPIIERREDGIYAYLEPPNTAPRQRERRAPAEAELISESPARGQPIPVEPLRRAAKTDKRNLSRPGTGHQLRQQQRRFEKVTGGGPKEAGKAGRRRARQGAEARRRNGNSPS